MAGGTCGLAPDHPGHLSSCSSGGGVLGGSPLLFALTGASLGVICTCRQSGRFPTGVLLLDNHTSGGQSRRGRREGASEKSRGNV